MRFTVVASFLAVSLSSSAAYGECGDPAVEWVEPDRANKQMGTNLRMLVAVSDVRPGGEVSGVMMNDETREEHTMTWEVIERDPGLPEGAAEEVASLYEALHIGTPSSTLEPDTRYTFTCTFTQADGTPVAGTPQGIWTAEGPDEAGPSLNGRFEVGVAEVSAPESCAFGAPELLFTFQGTDLHADGGDADSLQATLFQVTVRDTGGVVLYDTGYYTGVTWSALASRFEGRPDLCFDVTATDIYGNGTRYTNSYCVVLPGFEPPDAGPEPEGGPGGESDDFEPSGCTCRAASSSGYGVFLLAYLALGLRRRRA